MDYVQLAGKQAKEIEELKEQIKEHKESRKRVRMLLYCCGPGPLNDNNTGCNLASQAIFIKIAKEVEEI